MDDYQRHVKTFQVLEPIIRPLMKWIFRYDYEEIKDVEGPYLLLLNHNTDFDCIFAGLASKKQIYFVATEKITRMGLLGKIATKYFDPILHAKGAQGIGTVRSILTKMRQGHSVAMFPEGNRSFNGLSCPVPPATGKLARACGGTLVTYRFSGGYLSWPRWGKGLRRGKITGRIAGIYPREQLKAMSEDEINSIIQRDLYVDAYEDQLKEKTAYRGPRRKRAKGLASTLFCCPACKQIGTMQTKNDSIFCSCGYHAVYDVYGYLHDERALVHPFSETTFSITKWDSLQRKEVEAKIGQSREKELFSDRVICELINPQHICVEKNEMSLCAYPDRLVLGERTIPLTEIEGIAINQRNLLLLHVSGMQDHFECSGPLSFSALKYLYLVRAACGSRNGIL